MFRSKSARISAGLALTLAIATSGAALASASSTPPGAIAMNPVPVAAPTLVPIPVPPIYLPTGGPYVGEATALASAGLIARGPVSRQDVRFMQYRDVVAYTGNRTTTFDLDREVYFVVTSATFIGRSGEPICPSYMSVVDATTGDGISVICGDAAWPTRLPAAFK